MLCKETPAMLTCLVEVTEEEQRRQYILGLLSLFTTVKNYNIIGKMLPNQNSILQHRQISGT